MQSTIADAVGRALRDLLARGEYRPGDRLPAERELADALGVSRPALRETLGRMTDAGLLESRRGSGTYVAAVDLEAVFAVRLQLEPFAAELAARHRDDAVADQLAGLAEELVTALDVPASFAAIDLEIHRTVAKATGNPVLAGILERLTDLTDLSRAITSPEESARRATLSDIRVVVSAIGERDERAAATAMQRHLESVRDVAIRVGPLARRPARLADRRDR